jgi:hypothetical protein
LRLIMMIDRSIESGVPHQNGMRPDIIRRCARPGVCTYG